MAPLAPFFDRWRAKERDYQDFRAAWAHANAVLHEKCRWWLPDELMEDWEASWAVDLFRLTLPLHPSVTPERVREGALEVDALVHAIRYVDPLCASPNALRFWAYELPGDHRLPQFPTGADIRRHHADLDPRAGVGERAAGDVSRYGRWDQRQFLDRAAFLLNTPSDDDWRWLRRLAYRPDPLQPIWEDGLPYARFANAFRRTVPILSWCLGLRHPPQIEGEDVAFPVLLGFVQNWCLDARDALARTPAADGTAAHVEPGANASAGGGDRAGSAPQAAQDGPVEPYGLQWNGALHRFKKSERRHWRLLRAAWGMFRLRERRDVSAVLDEFVAVGGSNVEIKVLQRYARQLSNDILPRVAGFPARLVVSGRAIYWENVPAG